jgi:SAM-dependent methyltransferase
MMIDADGDHPTGEKRLPAVAALYPERRITTISRRQDFFVFFSVVAELVRKQDVVLDLGAGRGRTAEFGGRHMRWLGNLKGRCARLIGVDVDPVVLENPYLDEAFVIGPDGRLPVADQSIDLIYSFVVIEHVQDPAGLAAEIERVLKPGGWFCAWTPNRWGYIALGARLMPNRLHAKMLNIVAPGDRADKDVFPTQYRMNTMRVIRRLFPKSRFRNYSFTINGDPAYNFGSPIIAALLVLYMALTPSFLAQCLFVIVRKNPQA